MTTPPILFCAFDINGYGQVFAINVDGTGVVQLTPTAGEVFDYTWATWSPDGTKILAATDQPALWVLNADGTVDHQITNLQAGTASYQFNQGSWSPDATRVAILSHGTPDGIQLVSVDNSGFTIVNPAGGVSSLINHRMGWSPDGSKLAYCRPNSGGFGSNADAMMCNLDGSGATELVAATVHVTNSVWGWFADSASVVVESTDLSALDTHVMKASASGATDIYHDATDAFIGAEASPLALSPDETEFVAGKIDSSAILTVQGTTATSIYAVPNNAESYGIDWKPVPPTTIVESIKLGSQAGGSVRLG